MSKIKELEREETETESKAVTVAASKLPAAPATINYAEQLDNFRQAAAEGMQASFHGTLLKFRKGGWFYGKDEEELETGTRLIALMDEARRGWVKWIDKKAVKHVIGKIADGFNPPERYELGDNDEDAWPLDDKKPKDPWAFTMYLPLISPEGDQLFTYSTSSVGGTQAVYKLLDRYAWLGKNRPHQFPVVELNQESYFNKKYSNDTINPTLEIVDWADRPPFLSTNEAAAPTTQPSEEEPPPVTTIPDLGDDEEIPF